LFCHDGKWEWVQRLWVVRASTSEVWPLVEQQRHREAVGHEFFTRSGRVCAQYSWRFHPGAREWVEMDVFVQPDGSDPQAFRYPSKASWHIQVAGDETLGVADSAFPTEDFADGYSYIALLRYENERVDVMPLCRHNSSFKTQSSHPHPVFSPDDRWVYFNSDQGGRCNVYRAPVLEK
jgi:oligogalacturonide lyase